MTQLLNHLYPGEEIVIGPTTGCMTFAKAEDVFIFLGIDFKSRGLDQPGKATKATFVGVYEMVHDATIAEMFSSLGDLRRLVLTQHQIISFCQSHSDKLRQDGYPTFFLSVEEQGVFATGISVSERGLGARIYYRRDDDDIWYASARHRLVVPLRT